MSKASTALAEVIQWRIDELARPEHFSIKIEVAPLLGTNLSTEEYTRLKRKLLLVQNSAQRLCAAMVKGTIKYDADDLSLREWFNHLRDEALDQVNYTSLMEEQVEKASTNSS